VVVGTRDVDGEFAAAVVVVVAVLAVVGEAMAVVVEDMVVVVEAMVVVVEVVVVEAMVVETVVVEAVVTDAAADTGVVETELLLASSIDAQPPTTNKTNTATAWRITTNRMIALPGIYWRPCLRKPQTTKTSPTLNNAAERSLTNTPPG